MPAIDVKPADRCRWDQVSLGEIMLRLDPGETRVHTTRTFKVWEGGGEYNVARGLRRCFKQRTAVVTAIPENPVGHLLEDLILQGGVDTRYVKWVPFDGIGRKTRVGLNFVEKGYGLRGALSCSDRGHSAASQLAKGDVDWHRIFGEDGARWFHCGGIFAALGATTADVAIEAAQAARENGTVVSWDLNYRASLWQDIGGSEKAQEVNREIAKHVDVMIGNEEDFTKCLGYEVEGTDRNLSKLDPTNFGRMIDQVVSDYPHFKAVATTLRGVKTATVNDWGAVLWTGGELYTARNRELLEIYDRVGGGDSFASGLIYGFLSGMDPQMCVEYGAAHGALAMTTPGDTTMARRGEVESLVKGGSARVKR
jgi:2-dehydro-3-deoxygluconokinase